MKVFVDTAAVMEKPLAEQAGLGWQGKHTNLVSREFGSWLFLGAIFTTLELPPDRHDGDHCGSCRACLDACPTAAFPAPYRLDARRCISYLTIEHKGPIPRELRPLMGNRIYGCDDCLAVCPWNKYAQAGREAKLAARESLRAPHLSELARLDDARFRALFTKSPVKRTGRDRFIRNVLIAIGNAGDAALAADAERLLDDASPLVRGAAVWALARLDPARLVTHAGQSRSRSRSRRARGMDRRPRKRDGLMATLLCLGLGYCARYYVAEFGARFDRIIGTSRTPKPAGKVEMLAFDAASPSDEVRAAVASATHLLISATPGEAGDPIAAALGGEIAAAPTLEAIVYLSSLGVYGDHNGAWVDETAATIPAHARGGARLHAEQAWQELGRKRGVPVAVLRLAGIYGPGQNVFTRLLTGRAHRVAKPGHVFNRIHVSDIAQAIDAAFAKQRTASSTSPTTSPRPIPIRC